MRLILLGLLPLLAVALCGEEGSWRPYPKAAVEREQVFEFSEKPKIRNLGSDKYEITFTSKAYCDATVGVVDEEGRVVRHLASGVLGSNAPKPFQKNSLKQTLHWDGKDDLDSYHKSPTKLRVRVMLGLKPEFERLLGSTDPKDLPGYVWGLATSPEGVYVLIMGRGRGHVTCRRFDHDAKYTGTLWPPPANLPPEKLGGMGYIEYEPGKRALQAPLINQGMWRDSLWLPYGLEAAYGVISCRPAVVGNKIYLLSSGFHPEMANLRRMPPRLHYLCTDGSTEYNGLKGRLWTEAGANSQYTHLAASPDGKQLYLIGYETTLSFEKGATQPVVLQGPTEGAGLATLFAGQKGTPGSDNAHLNGPTDIACDAQGRVYVTDLLNNRMQVFAPDGKVLHSVAVDRPRLLQVHQQTGAVYLVHQSQKGGRSIPVLSRFSAFPALARERQWETGEIDTLALDSWSDRPRLWTSAGRVKWSPWSLDLQVSEAVGLKVLEDSGERLLTISDFEAEVKAAQGADRAGPWEGGNGDHLACDPMRGTVYWSERGIFDLQSGKFRGNWPGCTPHPSEMAFDRRGYLHVHMASGFEEGKQAIGRLDVDRTIQLDRGRSVNPEVPYDYGVERGSWKGVLPLMLTDHQLWTWGFGVNMRGDLATVMHVEFAPKMETEAWESANLYRVQRQAMGAWLPPTTSYETWTKTVAEQERKGLSTVFIQRQPGIPLTGATVWTFDAHGELKRQGAVIAGARNNGMQIDEDGSLYFTNARFPMVGDKPFLFESGGNHGGTPHEPLNKSPFTGAYLKTRGENVRFLEKNAKIPMDAPPQRPPDLAFPPAGSRGAYHGEGSWAWVEGAEWIYAGASPIVAEHCDCPQMRAWLDWYKRSFIPEAYRHSIGIVDTNGNLVLHLGQYGNFDSGYGPQSRVPLGGDGLATTLVRYVSGTDDHLCLSDWGQRIIVLKLNYHAQETVAIK